MSRSGSAAALACAIAACVVSDPSSAQTGDPVRGAALYLQTRTAPLSCGDNGACHGPDPRLGILRIRRGADSAATIDSAIARNRGGMGFLSAHVDARDIEDIAAWLGAVVAGRIEPSVAPLSPVPPAAPTDGASGSTDSTAQARESDVVAPFNVGYGGCSVAADTPVDLVLLALVAFAAAGLLRPLRATPGDDPARLLDPAIDDASTRRGFVIGAAALLVAITAPDARATASGDVAPDFDLPTPDAQRVSLAALRGDVVWLDFWASWCAPCRRSFPWMDAMQRRHGDAGLRVIAVSVDERFADTARFLAGHAVGFTVALDPGGRVARAYAVRAMPTSLLIGRDGVVRHVHAGFRDADRAPLESRLVEALASPRPAVVRATR